MGRKCSVPDCLSEEGRYEDRGVTFHKIPLHSDIRPKWMSLCHIPEDKYNIKVIHVCSRHFLKVDFCHFKGKRYMLKQGVLPSVFPWNKLKKDSTVACNSTKKEMFTDQDKLPTFTFDDHDLDTLGNHEIFTMDTDVKEEQVMSQDQIEAMQNEPLDESTIILTPACDKSTTKVTKKPFLSETSTTIEQKGKSIQTPSGTLNFSVNTRLEALDFNQMWFPARIIEIDYEENEVLIHFEKYSSKYDEWISMNSSRLRPIPEVPKKVASETFEVGEKCMASWSGATKFPATVTKIIDTDTYEVVFNDGFVKVLKSHRMAKAHGKVIGSAPLFDPVKGTKQDRRDKKRKINIAELFRKRSKTDSVEEPPAETASSTVADEVAPNTNEETETWLPKWENGRPVGTESTIETNDGLRKSVIVNDPRLPPNWQKHLTQRAHGASAGKWDIVILSPQGRRFRTRAEIKTFLEENSDLNLTEAMFDFSLHRRSRTSCRTAPNSENPPAEQSASEPIEDESKKFENLKILLVDDQYICPIDNCGRNFRRENLAQMHVKHYHPKYTKYLDSTPNVADLAYARTVGENLDKSPERTSKSTPVRQGQKTVTPKISTPKITVKSPSPDSESKIFQPPADSQINQLQKTKDSEILKLLSTKSQEEQMPKYPPGLPSNMYPDIKLKDLLNKSEGIPKRDDLNLKTLSATRPPGIKTLLPVVRSKEPKKEDTEEHQAVTLNFKPHSTTKNLKRKRQTSENTETVKLKEILELATPATLNPEPAQTDTNSSYIVEGGEIIKIVRMKREEIINCTCGVMEEDGLMIQCELCLCWQHAYCNNIERENQVPEKYICYICQNPMRQRVSKKYFHDQDWLKNGTLPVANYHCKDTEMLKKRFEKLKKSHDLSGRLVELKDFMHSLKVKLKIAESKDHPKLYLWSKQWEKHLLPEKLDNKNEDELKPKSNAENSLMKNDLDLLNSKNDSMLFSILKSTKDEVKMKDDIAGLDLNTFMDNNLEQLPLSAPIIPEPEAAIDSTDCQLNLLDHIAHSQNLVEERLNNIEAQVDALDNGENNNEEDFNRTCQTVQMLLRDLNKLKELSHSNSL